jgi:SAM-dependent methyltransferase
MGTYVIDQAWRDERERLAGIERLWDDGTCALLERIGVGSGSAVAEVAAGGGSVVEWLAPRVGPQGRVLATDVYLKFLEPLAGGPVEIVEHDILAEPLPHGQFDIVHARLLVEHVGTAALRNLYAGVRPGGVLLVEDYDFGCRGNTPADADFDLILESVIGIMSSFGFDCECGRKLPLELESLGLEDIRAEGRARVIRGGTPETAFARLTVTTLRERLVESGLASESQIDAVLQRLDDPTRISLSPLLVACWGRRPG